MALGSDLRISGICARSGALRDRSRSTVFFSWRRTAGARAREIFKMDFMSRKMRFRAPLGAASRSDRNTRTSGSLVYRTRRTRRQPMSAVLGPNPTFDFARPYFRVNSFRSSEPAFPPLVMLHVFKTLAIAAGDAEIEFLHVLVSRSAEASPSSTIRPLSRIYP